MRNLYRVLREAGILKDIENTKRRLRFRSWRRGTKESDLVIGGFADKFLDKLSSEQLRQFETLLDQNDHDVLSWVNEVSDPPKDYDTDVLKLIKHFKKVI